MQESTLKAKRPNGEDVAVPLVKVHSLVIGSGAAGLNAAARLKRLGADDVLIVTEGLRKGTSINTGSDKQTYYKLSLAGAEGDAPRLMAQTYFEGGSMHGDLALVEASLSARAFLHLVALGVPFPRDAFGQFVGYKTDHDPRRRATSVGPYTSREMCLALIRECEELKIPVRENRVVVDLLALGEGENKRAAGALALTAEAEPELYIAENVVFAVGGPGGLYKTSVYPEVHTGGIGLALLAGAAAQSLAESQYGLASTAFRWNVSGAYMQVIPRFISTAEDGASDEREFLRPYFKSAAEMNSMVFLKGYQWPFDAAKLAGGSSLIDLLVYIETVLEGRRVFLDFRRNGDDFRLEDLSDEALGYLRNSNALQATPIERLRAMNASAVDLYREHGIDLATEPLEVAVCAQHNNGGLAANHWWESVNIRHLFPVGEVNGSHGARRPGGSALNAGQVGGIRAAEFIAHRYSGWSLDEQGAQSAAAGALQRCLAFLAKCPRAEKTWREVRDEFQSRMTRAGAHVRSAGVLAQALEEARSQWRALEETGCGGQSPADRVEALRNRSLCFAHLVYLDAVRFAVASGVGSRGSAIVLHPEGISAHEKLGDAWRFAPEDEKFRELVMETSVRNGEIAHEWVPRRPIPKSDDWFETAWAAFREGKIYDE